MTTAKILSNILPFGKAWLGFILIFNFQFSICQAQKLTGRDIIQKVKDRPDGNTRYAEMELTLCKKNGNTRQRKVTSWAMDEGKDTKKMMFFTYPGDVKGTGFLTWDYDQIGKEDAKWLYLPAMKKTRRISGSSSKTEYFMGTDFTYDDMGSRHVDEDKHKLLREEMKDGHKCWVVESVPVDKHEIYSRKVSWIRQDCLMAAYVGKDVTFWLRSEGSVERTMPKLKRYGELMITDLLTAKALIGSPMGKFVYPKGLIRDWESATAESIDKLVADAKERFEKNVHIELDLGKALGDADDPSEGR